MRKLLFVILMVLQLTVVAQTYSIPQSQTFPRPLSGQQSGIVYVDLALNATILVMDAFAGKRDNWIEPDIRVYENRLAQLKLNTKTNPVFQGCDGRPLGNQWKLLRKRDKSHFWYNSQDNSMIRVEEDHIKGLHYHILRYDEHNLLGKATGRCQKIWKKINDLFYKAAFLKNQKVKKLFYKSYRHVFTHTWMDDEGNWVNYKVICKNNRVPFPFVPIMPDQDVSYEPYPTELIIEDFIGCSNDGYYMYSCYNHPNQVTLYSKVEVNWPSIGTIDHLEQGSITLSTSYLTPMGTQGPFSRYHNDLENFHTKTFKGFIINNGPINMFDVKYKNYLNICHSHVIEGWPLRGWDMREIEGKNGVVYVSYLEGNKEYQLQFKAEDANEITDLVYTYNGIFVKKQDVTYSLRCDISLNRCVTLHNKWK